MSSARSVPARLTAARPGHGTAVRTAENACRLKRSEISLVAGYTGWGNQPVSRMPYRVGIAVLSLLDYASMGSNLALDVLGWGFGAPAEEPQQISLYCSAIVPVVESLRRTR